MLVGDLFLGDIDGSEEFKTKENIENLYFMGVSQKNIDSLVTGKKRYVHGYKGTGKTSLLKLLENSCIERQIPFISLSYNKVREDAEIIDEFRRRFKVFSDVFEEENDKDTTTLTFWKWYLLSLIASKFIDNGFSQLIYNTKQSFFRAIASVLDMLVVTVDPNGAVSVGLRMQNIYSEEESESIVQAARNIRYLSNQISQKLNKKVVVFIDEVELTKARSTYGIDRTMIKNLILATKYINGITSNLHVLIALRDEVIHDLRGDEINKLMDNFGVKLSWWTNPRITVDHPLWRLMFKKIRYSMVGKENSDLMSDSQLWNRWFPFKIDGRDTWKFFFELTWARPRDFVRLLSLMKNKCEQEKSFTRSAYDSAIRAYSNSAYSEISEEISTLFDDSAMNKLQIIIQQLGLNFTSQEFYDEARIRNLSAPSVILDEIYRVGVVGNHFSGGNRKGQWRFFYRNDSVSDFTKAFEIHRALHDALGIKDTFRKSVFYSN
ncbi:hypothetical protein SAMN02746065_10630 [Desulfocicer vacuolatum DSM 3385]|uniref:KAP NTPase domain-containing protein n=1 Tax=Desulfocicer vacuolatum DSM 3385 TaxID=1121400 RepID=A0A1W2AS72_9BACT|nr:ATP-binding protein [Desulfocicer vacuolatum]SMC63048.1 hypothetical protein SAMN02746065_10630 [Desulfocicer vacuolatum DSM 3385]